MDKPTTALLHIEVVFADAARSVLQHSVQMPPASTVAQAIALCPFASHPFVAQVLSGPTTDQTADGAGDVAVSQSRSAQAAISIWGRKADLHHVLRDRDRIEICRPLLVDPKVARRERFAKQGSKAAGLFARRRPGAKPGY